MLLRELELRIIREALEDIETRILWRMPRKLGIPTSFREALADVVNRSPKIDNICGHSYVNLGVCWIGSSGFKRPRYAI
jgi:hypothetical protein